MPKTVKVPFHIEKEDGSRTLFLPNCRMRDGYEIGQRNVDKERGIQDYWEALQKLMSMPKPRFRRRNKNGIFGTVVCNPGDVEEVNVDFIEAERAKIGETGLREAVAGSSTALKEQKEADTPDRALIDEAVQEMAAVNNELQVAPGKEKLVEVKARVGQGAFRELLIKEQGQCAVTGVKEKKLLRASHIWPWAELRDNPEKQTDSNNGLLLSVTWDALFDQGLVTFDSETGRAIFSQKMDNSDLERLGVNRDVALDKRLLTPSRKEYLNYHRNHVFLG